MEPEPEIDDQLLVTVVSKDQVHFSIPYGVLKLNHFFTAHVDVTHAIVVSLPAYILEKVFAFSEHHVGVKALGTISQPVMTCNLHEIVSPFFADLMPTDETELLCLANAANYLQNEPMMHLCCAAIACRLKTLPPQELRKRYDEIYNMAKMYEEANALETTTPMEL